MISAAVLGWGSSSGALYVHANVFAQPAMFGIHRYSRVQDTRVCGCELS